MQQFIPHRIGGDSFLLTSDRSIYWQEKEVLILSDLHLGKTGHFRKSGIAIPQAIFKEDMQRFVTQLQCYKPKEVVVIGDMFHSHDNKEHELFLKWRHDFPRLTINLVKGNHDILKASWYRSADITINDCELRMGDFVFVHDFNDCTIPAQGYIFSGHIHPGISIKGVGNQSLHFPCFYFGEHYAVLPAFSKFTGTHPIKPKRGESVYALLPANPARGEPGGIMKI
jgi:DNA ligase-associated metallophosphoesterase